MNNILARVETREEPQARRTGGEPAAPAAKAKGSGRARILAGAVALTLTALLGIGFWQH